MKTVEPRCTGPYCVPAYDGTDAVVCPIDCSLCGINGDSFDDDYRPVTGALSIETSIS